LQDAALALSALVVGNVILAKVFRRFQERDSALLERGSRLSDVVRFVGWVAYVPVFGGIGGTVLALAERDWKMCLIAPGAICIGLCFLKARETMLRL